MARWGLLAVHSAGEPGLTNQPERGNTHGYSR